MPKAVFVFICITNGSSITPNKVKIDSWGMGGQKIILKILKWLCPSNATDHKQIYCKRMVLKFHRGEGMTREKMSKKAP